MLARMTVWIASPGEGHRRARLPNVRAVPARIRFRLRFENLHLDYSWLSPLPALHDADVDVEQIEATADGLVDDVVHAFRLMVEGRHRRHDDGAIFRRCKH